MKNSSSDAPKKGEKELPRIADMIARRRLPAAEAGMRRYLEKRPNDAFAWHNLGVLLLDRGQHEEAAEAATQAVSLQPKRAEFHFCLGNAMFALDRFGEAQECFERVAVMAPDHVGALCNLAVTLEKLGAPAEAEMALARAMALDPNHLDSLKALGDMKRNQDKPDEAEALFRKVLELAPDDPGAHRKLGLLLADSARHDEALEEWRQSIAGEGGAEDAASHCCLAIGLLRRGELEEGFKEFEWRRKLPGFPKAPSKELAVWNGTAKLDGKTILLYAEQGLGDTLQFLRFVPLVAAMGARVVLRCPATLTGLAGRVEGVAQALADDAELPELDFQASLPSLPHLLKTTIETIPGEPYLYADDDKAAAWRERLSKLPGIKVGLVWAGNPRHPEDRHRSLPMDMLALLPRIPTVAYVSLQVGPRSGEISVLRGRGADISDRLTNMDETAAAIDALDVVVCVDTSVAHLAGGMGKKPWILLDQIPDWRWGDSGDESPWYPGARLFRQPERGNWVEVMIRIGNELARNAPAMDDVEAKIWRNLSSPPAIAPFLATLGAIRLQRDDNPAAAMMLSLAAANLPPNAELMCNLGVALKRLNRLEDAEQAYLRAMEIAPNHTPAAFNLANLLTGMDRLEDALVQYRRALELEPDHGGAFYNMANALRDLGRLDEALAAYRRAMEISPDNAELKATMGMAMLLAGEFTQGWKAYEARHLYVPARTYECPRWDGGPLAGRTILLYAEQGMGDSLQFARYVPMVAQAGGRVVMEVQAPLMELFRRLPGVVEVVAAGAALPHHDLRAPLMDLPGLFATRLETIPATVPYMTASPARFTQWRERLGGQATKYRVGLVWAGNPRHKNDAKRSLALSNFADLPVGPGIAYYSLQIGDRAHDLAEQLPGAPITDLSTIITDFEDTAAILAELDLIITCDTSVAHLAGALGRPAWVLLPEAPDWRWLRNRDDSPWYPSMRLLRQARVNDWSVPMAAVNAGLSPVARGETASSMLATIQAAFARGAEAEAAAGLAAMRALWPDHPEARKLGEQAAQMLVTQVRQVIATNPQLAEQGFNRALALSPRSLVTLAEFAIFLVQRNRHGEGCAKLQLAALVQPNNPSIHYNMGLAQLRMDRPDESAANFRLAIALDPKHADALNELGAWLYRQGRPEEAEAELLKALAVDPRHYNALGNLALAYRAQDRLDEALEVSRRALEINPSSAELHWNYACVLLVTGRLAEGFREHEWRWRLPNFPSPKRNFTQPQWQGESLEGRTVLLHCEQGLGDTLQFLRYVPLVKEKGGRVILEVQGPLLELCRDIPGVDELCFLGQELPPFDLQIPLMSLPLVYGTDLPSVPAPIPYLRASAERVTKWAPHLVGDAALRVGLVWAGNPVHNNDRNRSMPFAALEPLARVPDVAFYSLQKGGPVEQLAKANGALRCPDLGSELGDFADTAAIIAGLDLVICADTAVAHLAGAMGKRVWMLVPFTSDWRWLRDRDDTPWYPTMRLFRQNQRGDWSGPVERAARALTQLVNEVQTAPLAAQFVKATAFHQQGQLAEAKTLYRAILAEDPTHAEALHHLGLIAYQSRRLDEAELSLRAALNINPTLGNAWSNLGVVLRESGRFDEAIECYRKALEIAPDSTDALYNLANALRAVKQDDEALTCLWRVLELKPDHGGALNNLGVALRELNRLDEAETVLRRLMAYNPASASGAANLALVLHDLKRDDEAVAICDTIAPANPNAALLQRTYAMVQKAVGRFEPALTAIERALAVEPDSGEGHMLRSSCLLALGKVADAGEAIDRAYQLSPQSSEIRWTRGFIDLISGRMERGWDEFEERWKIKKVAPQGLRFDQPLWNGEPLKGKTILIHAEQGLGDTLHFARYLPAVAKRGGKVVVEAQPPVLDLIGRMDGVAQTVARGSALPDFDCHLPLMSLPRVFKTRLNSIPDRVPYFTIPPERLSKWQARLPTGPDLKVGLVWAGSPGHANDRNRSLTLDMLQPVLSRPNTRFLSLQKGPAVEHLAGYSGAEIEDVGSDFQDFTDTAAFISGLDLVISVDTSVAHCAGAMNIPVWTLVAFAPDWRWLEHREDTPWYPSMRLYRQTNIGDWEEPIARMAKNLSARVAKGK